MNKSNDFKIKLNLNCEVIRNLEIDDADIDGEKGPDFPLRIQCIKGGIKLLGIKEDIQ